MNEAVQAIFEAMGEPTRQEIMDIGINQIICDAYAEILPGHEPMISEELASSIYNLPDESILQALLSLCTK